MDQRWILERLLDLGRTDGEQAAQIRTLFAWKESVETEERAKRSSFFPTFWQAISALIALGALLVAIFKPPVH